jgi:3-hydroxyisobutyrate dehydrogenase-like beta-hydroxyacid dehydrogenase
MTECCQEETMDIGFIGLGNMGAHMARRLLEAGHKVVVYDTRQEAIGNLAALGAIAARSPAEVADAAETVMASLPTPDVLLNVATGPSGVIEGKRVRRFVDLSTTGAVMAQRIFETLRAQHRADRQPGERRRARCGARYARRDGLRAARRHR